MLKRTKPAPGQTDLRGWEWRYLWQASRHSADGRLSVGTNDIASMAALEDGRTVVFGEVEGGFSLWDAFTGRETYRLPEVINRIHHPFLWGGAPIICRVALVPGTGLLAYTDCRSPTNGFVHLWHVGRRAVVRSIPIPGMPRYLAASPDGTKLACSLMLPHKRTLVLAVADGATVASLESEPSSYSMGHALAFSADSRALCLDDARARCVRLVEIDTGRELHRFPLEQDYPLTAVISPDGRWLVTGAGFSQKLPRAQVWDLQTGEQKMELPASSQFTLSFSPDGRRLVTGLSVWRVPEFTLEREFDGMDPNFKAALLLADGDTLLTEDGRGGVLRWHLSSPSPNRGGYSLGADVWSLLFLPQAEGVLLARTNGLVDRIVAPDFKPVPVPALGTGVATLTWIPDLGQFAVVRKSGVISLHAADTFEEKVRFAATTNVPTSYCCWIPRAGALVLLTADEHLEAWDVRSHQQVWQTSVLARRQLSAPTPDGVIWQVHVDGWLAGYDFVNRRVIRQPLDHDGMHRLALSADGHSLLLTSPLGAKRVVDTRTGQTQDRFENLDLPAPHGGAYWPNEDRIAFSGLHVVDRVTGRMLLTLEPDFAFPTVTYISDRGSLVLVAGGSRSDAYLWQAPSWEEIRQAEAEDIAAGW